MVDHWVLIPKAGVRFPLFQIITHVLESGVLARLVLAPTQISKKLPYLSM
jgi:hypothetical protein